jgi:hypothetical protein
VGESGLAGDKGRDELSGGGGVFSRLSFLKSITGPRGNLVGPTIIYNPHKIY